MFDVQFFSLSGFVSLYPTYTCFKYAINLRLNPKFGFLTKNVPIFG
jgi:hypothetical protein